VSATDTEPRVRSDGSMGQLRKLRGRSFDEWRVRIAQLLGARFERLQLAFTRSDPLARSGIDIAEALSASARPMPAALGSHSDAPRQIALQLLAREPNFACTNRVQLSHMRAGRIALLGLEPLLVGDPPNWHREAVSGQIAPQLHWSQIRYLDSGLVGDHKILWELNRHQYLLVPALSYLQEQDPRDFELIQRHLQSWLTRNPVRSGVNWASSLEVAYRAIVWCWLLWLLRAAPWERQLVNRIAASLEWHGLHIERNLSTYFSPNTHLTGEALGLFYVGTALPESPHATRWRTLGARILESWFDKQVLSDGVYFEQASQYQRYTAEIYLHYLQLGRSTRWPISERVENGLHRLLDVLRSLAGADGRMPLIGDDDGGHLLPFDQGAPDQLNGVLLLGATMLDRPDLLPDGEPQRAAAYFCCGTEAVEAMLARPRLRPNWRDMYFAAGGIASLRDGWDRAASVATVDAGPHGAMNCGHAHADALSMTLRIAETPLFVDRGTLTYVGSERNEYRETSSHNSMEFDGESSVLPQGPFQWATIPPRPTASLHSSSFVSVFTGCAQGHAHSTRRSTHHRAVVHQLGGAWLVFDNGSRESSKFAVTRWQLHPQLQVEQQSSHQIMVRDSAGRSLATLIAATGVGWIVSQRNVSLRYARRESAQLLQAPVDENFQAVLLVLPANIEIGGFTNVAHDNGRWSWVDAVGRHTLAQKPCKLSGQEQEPLNIDSDLVWCTDRRVPDTDGLAFRPDLIVAINARSVTVPCAEPFQPNEEHAKIPFIALEKTATGWCRHVMDRPMHGME
jgi:hypothetical protein